MLREIVKSETFARLVAVAIVVMLILFATNKCNAQFNADSTTFTIDTEVYKVQTGPKGGKFIILGNGEKKYCSSLGNTSKNNLEVAEGQKTILWEGKTYDIQTGPKGGLYFVDSAGKKRYLKKKSEGQH